MWLLIRGPFINALSFARLRVMVVERREGAEGLLGVDLQNNGQVAEVAPRETQVYSLQESDN